MRKASVATSVTRGVGMELVDEEGSSAAIDTELTYDPADPFAVTIVFKSDDGDVRWTFGRDLLVTGQYEPIGAGDVQVWPCLAADGSAVVILELCSPAGGVLIQAPSRDVHQFVTRVLHSVPLGAELENVDLDAEIDALLSV